MDKKHHQGILGVSIKHPLGGVRSFNVIVPYSCGIRNRRTESKDQRSPPIPSANGQVRGAGAVILGA